MPKQSPSQRVTDKMAAELSAQSSRLVSQLQSEFSGHDRENISTADWHEMIRANWQDPMWRQAQAVKNGDVAFVHDALAAFAIPKSALSDHQPLPPPTMPASPIQQQPPSLPQPIPIPQPVPGATA